jgi:hypothetical protein
MINTLDLQECEILLPGEWIREGSGDSYSFTTERMELRDERLFKQLVIREKDNPGGRTVPYALSIREEYCGVVVGQQEFTILRISSATDGSATMEWEDSAGNTLRFARTASHV